MRLANTRFRIISKTNTASLQVGRRRTKAAHSFSSPLIATSLSSGVQPPSLAAPPRKCHGAVRCAWVAATVPPPLSRRMCVHRRSGKRLLLMGSQVSVWAGMQRACSVPSFNALAGTSRGCGGRGPSCRAQHLADGLKRRNARRHAVAENGGFENQRAELTHSMLVAMLGALPLSAGLRSTVANHHCQGLNAAGRRN